MLSIVAFDEDKNLSAGNYKLKLSKIKQFTLVGSMTQILLRPRPKILSAFLPQTKISPLLVRALEDSSINLIYINYINMSLTSA